MPHNEQKISIKEEELMAMDTDLSSKIHTAMLLSEDMGERENDVNEIAAEFKDVFKNRDDAVLFAMLPLSKKTRMSVLERAREIQSTN